MGGLTGMLALAMAGACALGNPPTDDSAPPHGGLPQGVTAAPPATQVGPVTTPTPAGVDPMPAPAFAPGSSLGEAGGTVVLDSATRLMSARLDTVIGAMSRGLTSMPIPVARSVVQGISGSLRESTVPRLRAVSTELDALDALLSKSPIDGRAVGLQLQRLASRSAAASPEAGVLAGRVARLSDLLQEAGKKLAGQ